MGCVYLSTAQTCSCSLHGSNSRAHLHEPSNIINTATNPAERESKGGYKSTGVCDAIGIILGILNDVLNRYGKVLNNRTKDES